MKLKIRTAGGWCLRLAPFAAAPFIPLGVAAWLIGAAIIVCCLVAAHRASSTPGTDAWPDEIVLLVYVAFVLVTGWFFSAWLWLPAIATFALLEADPIARTRRDVRAKAMFALLAPTVLALIAGVSHASTH